MTSREDWFLPPRNFMGLSEDYANYERARVLVLPVPYDSTTSYKSGAREGPQAILDASQQLEWFDHELERETVAVGIHTLAEVAPVMAGPETMVARVYGIARELVASEKLLVTLGGEHSLSSSLVLAFLDQHPDLTVLHIDAHADMRDLYEETPYSHACVARRISELCPIVQAGIRSLSKEEWDYMQGDPNITTFFAEQHPLSTEEMERLVAALGPKVYVTIDVDSLDPSIVPGVGTPEPGGLGWYEIVRLLRTVSQRCQILGFDVMEYCPPQGNTAGAFSVAKLAYKLMGYATHPWPEGAGQGLSHTDSP